MPTYKPDMKHTTHSARAPQKGPSPSVERHSSTPQGKSNHMDYTKDRSAGSPFSKNGDAQGPGEG